MIFDCDREPHHPSCFYLFNLKCVRHAADNTCASQCNQIKQFLDFLEQLEIGLEHVSTEVVQKYLFGYLFKKKKLQASTIKIHSTTLFSFFKFCFERCFISERVIYFSVFTDEYVESQQTYAELALEIKDLYMTNSDIKLLCEHVSGNSDFIRKRNRLAMMFGYYAGLRTSDVASNPLLTVAYFKRCIPNVLEGGELPISLDISYINKKSSKKVSLNIEFALISAIHDFIYDANIQDKLTSNTPLICQENGSALNDDRFASRKFSEAVENLIAAGNINNSEVKKWRKRHFHICRKCFATNKVVWCREQGLPPSIIVRDYLGHADFGTSIKHYIYADWLLNQHNNKEYLTFLTADETSLGRKFMKKSAIEM
ncbi:site-specific integrase [Shewanella pneumatophori]|uniref:Site-specific integrase n=1 Tax=Shewanella pneumatophori TaxID=314092 RepID=A0A9X1ZI40_9GAMM|nr:site-specific integrase [Shewanella pneumatophori]MCL1140257.1 site-specific integrase [Shewanella pneumatophori]